MKKRKRKVLNVFVALLVFILLIASAFGVGLIFGLIFFFSFIYAAKKGEIKRRPFLAIGLYIGSLITSFALKAILLGFLDSKITVDGIISFVFFLAILIFGYAVKKGWFLGLKKK